MTPYGSAGLISINIILQVPLHNTNDVHTCELYIAQGLQTPPALKPLHDQMIKRFQSNSLAYVCHSLSTTGYQNLCNTLKNVQTFGQASVCTRVTQTSSIKAWWACCHVDSMVTHVIRDLSLCILMMSLFVLLVSCCDKTASHWSHESESCFFLLMLLLVHQQMLLVSQQGR